MDIINNILEDINIPNAQEIRIPISHSFTMLKDSEANMNCNEEPLETNTANEFENITIKKEIVDPEETFADIKPIETLTTMPQPNYN